MYFRSLSEHNFVLFFSNSVHQVHHNQLAGYWIQNLERCLDERKGSNRIRNGKLNEPCEAFFPKLGKLGNRAVRPCEVGVSQRKPRRLIGQKRDRPTNQRAVSRGKARGLESVQVKSSRPACHWKSFISFSTARLGFMTDLNRIQSCGIH